MALALGLLAVVGIYALVYSAGNPSRPAPPVHYDRDRIRRRQEGVAHQCREYECRDREERGNG